MKKLVFIAAFAISGIVLVSCDTEAVDGNSTPHFDKFTKQKEIHSETGRATDSILTDTITANLELDPPPPPPGPGDDLPPIKPPKP
ncbi:hypothetical protein [Flavobacterium sp.]|uniref:hypothetical protein n=1 Tax=Flavobacterium sp. TaxID=239 RepID=UPI003D6BA284